MIDDPSGYVFTDVTGVKISGDIIPAVDGTPACGVVRMEDVCHLVEALHEGSFWFHPRHLLDGYRGGLDYNPNDMILSLRILDQLHNWSGYMGGDSIEHGVIRDDWVWPETLRNPYLRLDTEGSGPIMNDLIDTFGFEPVSCHPLQIDDLDTYRRLYYDFGRKKRFYWNAPIFNQKKWNLAFEEMSMGDYAKERCCLGVVAFNDGDHEYVEYEGGREFRTPWQGLGVMSVVRRWSLEGDQIYFGRNDGSEAAVVIAKGRHHDENGNALLADTLDCFYVLGGSFSYTDDPSSEDPRQVSRAFDIVIPGKLRLSSDASGTPFEDVADSFYRCDTMENSFVYEEIVRSEINRLVAGFRESPRSLYVYMSGVVVDTGVVPMRTSLPDSWAWKPDARACE